MRALKIAVLLALLAFEAQANFWAEPQEGWTYVRPTTFQDNICAALALGASLFSRSAVDYRIARLVSPSVFSEQSPEVSKSAMKAEEAARFLKNDSNQKALELKEAVADFILKSTNLTTSLTRPLLTFRSEHVGPSSHNDALTREELVAAAQFDTDTLRRDTFRVAENEASALKIFIAQIKNAAEQNQISESEADALFCLLDNHFHGLRFVEFRVRYPGRLNIEWEESTLFRFPYAVWAHFPYYKPNIQ